MYVFLIFLSLSFATPSQAEKLEAKARDAMNFTPAKVPRRGPASVEAPRTAAELAGPEIADEKTEGGQCSCQGHLSAHSVPGHPEKIPLHLVSK